MNAEQVKRDIENIQKNYWNYCACCFSEVYYDKDDNECHMEDEIEKYFQKNNIKYEIEREDGTDRAGYCNSSMAFSYVIDGELYLKTVLFEMW